MQMQLLVLSGKKVCTATQKASGENFHQRAKRAHKLSVDFFALAHLSRDK
jgi:hypothetical protein